MAVTALRRAGRRKAGAAANAPVSVSRNGRERGPAGGSARVRDAPSRGGAGRFAAERPAGNGRSHGLRIRGRLDVLTGLASRGGTGGSRGSLGGCGAGTRRALLEAHPADRAARARETAARRGESGAVVPASARRAWTARAAARRVASGERRAESVQPVEDPGRRERSGRPRRVGGSRPRRTPAFPPEVARACRGGEHFPQWGEFRCRHRRRLPPPPMPGIP